MSDMISCSRPDSIASSTRVATSSGSTIGYRRGKRVVTPWNMPVAM